MTKPKHTPGPWKVHGYRKANRFNMGIDVGPGQLAIAEVFGEFEQPTPGLEAEANARLIAAAPELLNALRLMMAYFASDIEGFDEDDPKYVAFQEARAAIAKATGEA